MRRSFLALACALGLVASLSGQVIDTQFVSAASSDCSTASSCAVFQPPSSTSSLTITVTGTFSATLILEATSDNVAWVTAQGTNVADGSAVTAPVVNTTIALSNVGYVKVRVRASAYVSGTVRVSATKGYAHSARVGGGGSGSGSGYTNLFQDGVNGLFERNSTNAQEFKIAETYTDANTNSYLDFLYSASAPQGGSTNSWVVKPKVFAASVEGAPRNLYLWASNVTLRANGSGSTWSVDSNGNWIGNGGGILMNSAVDTGYRNTFATAVHGLACWTTNQLATSATSACITQQNAGVVQFLNSAVGNDGSVATGTWMAGDNGTKPTCAVGIRGTYWHDFGGAGVKDTIEICAKDAGDAYAWRTVY